MVTEPSAMSPVPGSHRVEQLAQAVAERVVTMVMDAIDIDALLERIDVDAVVGRVDVDGLIDRVDVEKIIERVDVEKIIDRIDIDALVETDRAGHDHRPVDQWGRLGGTRRHPGPRGRARRLLRPTGQPTAPALEQRVAPGPADFGGTAPVSSRAAPREAGDGYRVVPAQPIEGRQGHYAGAVSRLVAFAADVGASWGLFTVGAAALTFTIQLVSGTKFSLSNYQIASLVAAVVWEFVYFAYQWALSGKTIGMALLGIRVVQTDGAAIGARQAVVRTLTLPLSFLLLGLGFLGILTNRDRHALHDRLAGTAVVYSWDARAARLRWLARQDGTAST